MRSPAVLVLATSIALLVGACGRAGDGGEAGGGTAGDPSGDWTLTAGTTPDGEVEVGDGVAVTLTVDGSSWGGQVCNSYGAQDVTVGDDGSLRIGDVPRTEMACLDDRLMTAENRYLAAFTQVTAYEVDGDELRLTGDGTELTFARRASEPPADLVGTVWVLDTVVAGDGPDGTASTPVGDEATLELHDDFTITASSGCVTYPDLTYRLSGERLHVTFGSTIDHDCPDRTVAAQDLLVRNVLEDDPTIELQGQRLTLTGDGRGLSYVARG